MVSTVFGMMMAIAGDLPAAEPRSSTRRPRTARCSTPQGRKLGTLLSNTQRILVESEDISPYMKNAVVAIEDERFYEHRGVDFAGIGRAARPGPHPRRLDPGRLDDHEQFVKNALEAQGSRTVFQKFREAALAYHLERQWDKDKILTQYLNTIYFGEGAYGIEAAARTYFGDAHPDCLVEGADPCASSSRPRRPRCWPGSSPRPRPISPRVNPRTPPTRRNLVLQKMPSRACSPRRSTTTAVADLRPRPV